MYSTSSKYKGLFFLLDMIAIGLSYGTMRVILAQPFTFFHHYIYGIELILLTLLSNMFSKSYRHIEVRTYIEEIQYSLFYAIQVVVIFGFLVFVYRADMTNDFHRITLKLLLVLGLVSFGWVYILRMVGRFIYKNIKAEKKKVILISSFNHIERTRESIEDNCDICAYVYFQGDISEYNNKPVLHNMEEIRQFISENIIDEIYVPTHTFSELRDLITDIKDLGIPTNIDITSLRRQFVGDVAVHKVRNKFFITSALRIVSLPQMFLKRLMDIIGGLVGTIICIIAGLLIYPKVQKESPGPMIFKQKRVGKNGRIFNMYKFRSMYLDAEERKKDLISQNNLETSLMFKMDNDPRVFPFGQKLRDLSTDELPQFINVLKGDMSLVGTRPPTIEEYKNYELRHFKRLVFKPGITGLWQVSGRSDIRDFDTVVSLDCQYIQNWSLMNDIKILLKTIQVVLKKKGSR